MYTHLITYYTLTDKWTDIIQLLGCFPLCLKCLKCPPPASENCWWHATKWHTFCIVWGGI